jgi:transposase-like protein
MTKCPNCKSEYVVEYEAKHTNKGYWCDDCSYEWVAKK